MMKNRKKNQLFFRKFFFGVKKSKFANRLKRALPKFRGDRSEVRGVNGRSKFVAASAGFAKRKQFSSQFATVMQISFGRNFEIKSDEKTVLDGHRV